MSENMPITESQDTAKLIFTANKISQQQLIIGILLIIMGIFTLAVTGGVGGAPIGIGVMSIVLSFILNGRDYVTLDTDCISMKMGFRARVSVLFSEINSIEKADKKITLFYKIHGEENAAEKKLVIALNIMDNKTGFLEAFDKRYYK